MNSDDQIDDDAAPACLPQLSREPRASLNRAPPITLPSDPSEASALVLRFIQAGGSTAFDRSAALEAAAKRLGRLQDADPDIAFAELGGHAAILDSLFLHWAARAVSAPNNDAATKFAKLALSSQNSYARTLIAMEGLRQQRRGRGRVTIESDHDDDADRD